VIPGDETGMGGSDAMERLKAAFADSGASLIIDGRCDRFRSPALAGALAVWRDKAGSAVAPRRSDMTPQVMRPFLKRVALFECLPGERGTVRYRARITSQEFAAAFAEMTGKFVDEVVDPKYLARWKAVLEVVQARLAPLRIIGVPQAFNRDNSVLEMVLVPLLDDDGKPNFVLFVGNFEHGRDWAEVEADEARYL
jgi:hypothetical protein